MGNSEVLPRGYLEAGNAKKLESSARPVPQKWWRWWQWALAYPGLLTVMWGAVPNPRDLWQSYTLKVPVEVVNQAIEQNKLWEKNHECTLRERPVVVKTDTNQEVEVTLCPSSGDILVKVQPSNKSQSDYRWIGVDAFNQLSQSRTIGSYLVPDVEEAFAEEIELRSETLMLAQYGPTVLCQSRDSHGFIVRIIQVAGGGCWRESINPYTGQVVNSTFWPSCSCS